MMLLKVAIKEILQNIRDVKTIALMTLMPIASILILGMAISSAFSHSGTVSMEDVHVEYLVEGEKGALTTGFENIMGRMLTDDRHLVEVDDRETSLNRIKNNAIACLVEINEANQSISLYKNNRYNTNGSIIEARLRTYMNHINAVYAIKGVDTELPEEMPLDGGERDNTITINELDLEEPVSAMDYYGVAMSILFVLYSMSVQVTRNINEKKKGAMNRVLVSSIRKRDILLGKVLGGVTITTLQFAFVIATTLFIFNVNWGTNPAYTLILMFTFIIMAISIGTALGVVFNSEDKAMAVLHVFIVMVALFGGSYMPLTDLGVFGEVGKYFSPIWWSVRGAMETIYQGDTGTLYIAMGINIGIALVFLLLASWRMTKKEGLLHG
ncbi:ABC transporter permease [Vallitalea pronyensis]|uniref:ABC transporter permease n=1 Tax=Vallitalea pronyensis TaxID=1348613 RepID=A0A8J8MIL0_9FIRM|nr:ABC transporter permease [Vallitalea pronyensis]QUI22502.1 ABC transporter permease [Vallitalea pronyensis]